MEDVLDSHCSLCALFSFLAGSVVGGWVGGLRCKAKGSSGLWLFISLFIYLLSCKYPWLPSRCHGCVRCVRHTHHETFIQWSLKSRRSTGVLEENPGSMLRSQQKTERYREDLCITDRTRTKPRRVLTNFMCCVYSFHVRLLWPWGNKDPPARAASPPPPLPGETDAHPLHFHQSPHSD